MTEPRRPIFEPSQDRLRIGVVVGLDLVGDALIKLPFVRALRAVWPDAEIHWITSKGPTAYAGPLRRVTHNLIDIIDTCPDWMPDPKSGARSKTLPPGPQFDLLIDTRGRWRDALLLRRHLAPHLFISPALRFFLSGRRPLPFTPRPRHLVGRLFQMIDIVAGYVPIVTGRLELDQTLINRARSIMPDGPTYVGFAPGAGNVIKVWPLDRFIDVAKQQAAQGRTPVFLLGPDETAWQDQIRTAVPTALFPLQERAVWGTEAMSIDETMAVASLLCVAVSNDSGTGHMLAAVDCPLISLFGPTDPGKLAPRISRGTVIRSQTFGGDMMDRIPTDSVTTALESEILFQKSIRK